MIKSFKHKGLWDFFNTGSLAGISPDHKQKLQRILAVANSATKPEDLNLPGFRLHRLEGEKKGRWSIRIDKNWRFIFRFDGQDIVDVDYDDYH